MIPWVRCLDVVAIQPAHHANWHYNGQGEVASRARPSQAGPVQVLIGWILALALLSTGAACDRHPEAASARSSAAPTTEGREAVARGEPAQPNPPLTTTDLFLGAHRIKAEVARSPREIQTGMMFRDSMGEDEGMLFVFTRPHRASFWMKNVTVPLSAAYLDPAGRVLEIHDLQPGNTTPVPSKSDRVQFVLETSRGWFDRHNIGIGTLATTEKGSLPRTFFGREH